MRIDLKKCALLFLVVSCFISNQGCQTRVVQNDVSIHEVARYTHAKQLLGPRNPSLRLVREFENDLKFPLYIEKYIEQENSKLDSAQLMGTLLQVSRDHYYDPVFLLAVVKTESQFNPSAIGSAGEIGLMQIKPDTAEWICLKKKLKWMGPEALKNPSYNIQIGAAYFEYLKRTVKNKKEAHYVVAYNMGLSNLSRIPAAERNQSIYLEKVVENYRSIYEQLKKIRNTI